MKQVYGMLLSEPLAGCITFPEHFLCGIYFQNKLFTNTTGLLVTIKFILK